MDANLWEGEQQQAGGPLALAGHYTRGLPAQLGHLLAKDLCGYWRTPEYGATRMTISVGVALIFGSMYWMRAHRRCTAFTSGPLCLCEGLQCLPCLLSGGSQRASHGPRGRACQSSCSTIPGARPSHPLRRVANVSLGQSIPAKGGMEGQSSCRHAPEVLVSCVCYRPSTGIRHAFQTPAYSQRAVIAHLL